MCTICTIWHTQNQFSTQFWRQIWQCLQNKIFQFSFRSKPFAGCLTFHTSTCMLNGVQIRALGCPITNLDLFSTQIFSDWLSVYPVTLCKYFFLSPSPSHVFFKTCCEEKGWRWAQTISGVGDGIFFRWAQGHPDVPNMHKVHKEYNIRRHYSTRHVEEYAKYQGDEWKDWVAKLKTCLLMQQDVFKKASKESDAAVKAN